MGGAKSGYYEKALLRWRRALTTSKAPPSAQEWEGKEDFFFMGDNVCIFFRPAQGEIERARDLFPETTRDNPKKAQKRGQGWGEGGRASRLHARYGGFVFWKRGTIEGVVSREIGENNRFFGFNGAAPSLPHFRRFHRAPFLVFFKLKC